MKNLINKKSHTLILSLIILQVVFLFSPQIAGAQMPVNESNQSVLAEDSPAPVEMQMTSFTARFIEGVVYLKWLMKGESEQSLFVVERSDNSGDYHVIGMRKGFPSPQAEMDLLYCFSDPNIIEGNARYRIVQFVGDKKTTSFPVMVENYLTPSLVVLSSDK